MASPERPQADVNRNPGTQGDALSVMTDGGQITVTGNATDVAAVQARGDQALSDAGRVTRGQLSRQNGHFRGIGRESTVSLQNEVTTAKRNSRGDLYPATRARLLRQVDSEVRRQGAAQRSAVESNVSASTRRALRAQLDVMRRMGVPPPTRAQMNSLASRVARASLTTDWPGTNTNTNQRINALQARSRQLLTDAINQPTKDKQNRAIRRARNGLHASHQNKVRGGNVSRQMERISRTEQARAARDATMELAKMVGFKFAYWRLSAQHKSYGGKEICEKLAVSTGPDVEEKLKRMGVDPATVLLEGLYSIGSFPHIPHPNCMCFQEMWHPPELLEQLNIDQFVEKGVLPGEIMSASKVPQEAAAVFNRFMTPYGLDPTINSSQVAALGIEGMAQLTSQSLTAAQRRQALGQVRQLQRELTPQIESAIQKARRHRDRLTKEIQADTLLSPTTKASNVAKIREQFQAELSLATAQVSTLQSLERAFANPNRPLISASSSSSFGVVERMKLYPGLQLGVDYRIVRDGGRYSAVFEPKQAKRLRLDKMQKADREVAELKRAAEGKTRRTLAQPKGMQEGIKLRTDQIAGAKFIENQENVLLHFGAGLGKTPLVIGSVSDLHAQGKIQAAAIATPAALRTQMVSEIMVFNRDAPVVMYVGASQVGSTAKAIRQGIDTAVLRDVPTIKKYGRLFPDPKKVPEARRKELLDEIQKRESRVEVKPMPKDADGMKASLAADRKKGVLYTVMGHDDLAKFPKRVSNSFDYVAIDEIHQMTSQSTTGGSFKANRLQQITGGKLKYRVGLTGTASRNNVGEFWDIANWLRPGYLGGKGEFIQQYSQLTLQSDVLGASLINTLRQRIDSFTFTRESPVQARINNAFATTHPDGTKRSKAERDKYLREVEMTPQQAKRAKRIEEQFDAAKREFNSMSAQDRQTHREWTVMAKQRLKGLARTAEVMDYLDTPNLAARMRRMGIDERTRKEILSLRKSVEAASRIMAPETWRDNQHHKNLHGGKWTNNAKVLETQRLVTNELAGKRPIIHVERIESLEQVRAALKAKGLKVGTYDGSMNASSRDAVKAQFNGGELDAIIVTRAGSTGLNLQRASTATIHFDTPWTQAEYLQREARNWRTGQQHDVESYTLTHGDMYTDRRRLDYMRKKGKTLSALDEITKRDDRHNPLAPSQRAKDTPLDLSYDDIVAVRGRQAADRLLADLQRELTTDLSRTRQSSISRETPLRDLLNPR